jgi:hypothetical protein
MKQPFWKHLLKSAGVNLGIVLIILIALSLFEFITGRPSWYMAVALVVALIIGEAWDGYKKERPER